MFKLSSIGVLLLQTKLIKLTLFPSNDVIAMLEVSEWQIGKMNSKNLFNFT